MTTRRDFLKSVSVGGALLCVSEPWCLSQNADGGERIENEFLAARFDTATGQIQVERKNGLPLLRNAVAQAVFADGIRRTSDGDYQRSATIHPHQDALGKGHQLRARCVDRRKQVDFEILLTLYDARSAVVVEVTCRNASGKDTRLTRIEPVRAVLEEGSFCGWANANKALTNGYMYPDPGRVEEIGQSNRHAITSMWNMGFYRGEREEGLVVGYLENNVTTGRISAMYDRTVLPLRTQGGLSLIAESLYGVDYILRPGASATSERVMLNLAPDPFEALETYAEAVGETHQVRLNPIINGWCSWFYSHEYINEEEVLKNTEFASRALKAYGLEYVQIDAGWFRTYGDWEGNQNFPHGMKWLARQIQERGLHAGLWLAPYCIAEGTEVFDTHQDWLLRDHEGRVRQCGGGLTSPQAGPYGIPSLMKKVYGLDVTHPGAAGWLRELIKKVSDDWGYEFIKIDFVEWSLLSAERYHDRSSSQAGAYRKGFEIMREGMGPRRHLLDCGPMNNTVGLADSARIELDQPRLTWEQYAGNFNSTAPAMAKRYYFNQKTWINDADHLGLGLLNLAQSRAAASMIALSGGTVISGDRLVDLDPERLEILRKVYPSYGVAARPIDLFDADRPEIFEIPIKTKFAEWSIVALFNYANGAAEKSVSLKRMRLVESKRYMAFDFWNQRLAGEFDDELRVRVEPESVAVLSVHPVTGIPRVVSTDRHFTQGAVELDNVKWETSSNILSGTSMGAPGSAHNISIHVPKEYRWDSERPEYYRESGQYSLKQTSATILRLRVRFEGGAVTPWQVQFVRAS